MNETNDRNPTNELWTAYQAAFDHFNAELWAGKLPRCILNFSRKRGAYGFFWAERWAPAGEEKKERAHEISLNPDHSNRSERDVASTLVHEMAHHWQQCFGKPSKGAYHNKQWGTEMKRIGLQPVAHGGGETGTRVSHTVVDGGAFLAALEKLPTAAMPWRVGPALADAAPLPPSARQGNRNKTAYVCGCGSKVWGKPGMSVHCNECDEDFAEAE